MRGFIADLLRAVAHLRRAPSTPADPVRVKAGVAAICARRGVASWADRFVDGFAFNASGQRLHLDIIATAPDAPTFVFMPGTNAYSLLYGPFLTALADRGFNIVAFDPRGHGRSDGSRGSYIIPELVADMQTVIRHATGLFSGPIIIGGSSQGGIVSLYTAADPATPPLAGAFCHNLADLADPASARLVRAPRLGRALRPLVRAIAWVAPELPVPMPAYLDLHREPVRGYASAHEVLFSDPALVTHVRMRTLVSLGSTALARPPEAIDTPVFVLHADADTIFPTDLVSALARRLASPLSRLHIVPDAPHYLVVDDVPSFIEPLTTWLHLITSVSRESPGLQK